MELLKRRYLRLREKALGKALNPAHGAIFQFPKFCRACGTGMTTPSAWDKRAIKKLFKSGYHSEKCREKGETFVGTFPMKAPGSEPTSTGTYAVEEMAFVSLEIKREEEKMNPMKLLVYRARQAFRLLSEQLAYLECETGESWNSAKCRYWMGKK